MIDAPVTIVTGTSQGFGALTAETLARRGHRVFAGMRALSAHNSAAAERLEALAAAEGIDIQPIELDVTDDASVAAAVERVVSRTGRIDALVNNAGELYFGVTEAFTVEQVRDQLDVNVLGSVRMNRAVLPHMRRRARGVLVHVGSIGGRLIWPFYGIYCASKHALEAIAEAYRYELSAAGVDSVLVQPGAFPTQLTAARRSPADSGCVAAYGDTAEACAAFIAGVELMLSGADAPDPQLVADAIADLIDAPPGTRPLRTVVGLGFGTEEINEAAAPYALAALDAFGLSALSGLQPAAPSAAG